MISDVQPQPAVDAPPAPEARESARAASRQPRLVIEAVAPQVNCGRHPVKRVEGDAFRVECDVLAPGHDRLAARVRYRPPGERGWLETPMTYDEAEDRWWGTFELDRLGRWLYTVEAWTDHYASWGAELERWIAAGESVESHLLEGAALVAAAAARARGEVRRTLGEAGVLLRDPRVAAGERAAAALAPELERLVRPYAPRPDLTRYARRLPLTVDRERACFAAWYEMFPRSQAREPGRHGTFGEAEWRLPQLAKLGFDVVYLPPIHPIGRTNRKGPGNTLASGPADVGSPWAIGSEEGGHTAVHPDLGSLADFERFVKSADALGMEVALDYALQCSPDHPWVRDHPDWFFVREDGSIQHAQNPPKKYEDIVPLNFWCEDRANLWRACRDVLLFWIARGVRMFRVDNPHTKPLAFWEWVIAEVQREHPSVVFLSEAFTRPKRMKALAKLGFTQSYTYFTWRNTAAELREYLTELTQSEMAEYFRPNFFANTPDILHAYLQRGGRAAFRVRLLLAATLSPLYGIYSGFELAENEPAHPGSEEYLHSEKYEIRQRDWDAPGNLNAEIARLNRIRRDSAALRRLRNLTFLPTENEQILFYRKSAPPEELLVVVNLDPDRMQETMVHVPVADLNLGPDEAFIVEDLLTGERYVWRGARNYVRLDPWERAGHLLRLERPRPPLEAPA